jgi:ATP-dependent Clp protease ATP-binding subunit ClpA
VLREGTDMKYGARHLKRAIDRTLVQPLSNLIATGQICGGDLICVDFDLTLGCLAERNDFFVGLSLVDVRSSLSGFSVAL